MKSIKYFAVAATLSLASFATFAAQEVSQPADGAQKIGVVTASGATTLDSLETDLANQAKQAGASSYRITSVTGNNLMNASAVLYK
ncbi:YdgH/BhsA/McbA-like domain containing protein [Rouxiella sp. WC2420]|uniref:YdgH/BhsA/McbA-like domain containing protein n=1 Tax=Rouxiella sp. WC2420 TaxID=3234145 RepID=A0AB39VR10_9GAMM